jgi:hypothetical protein
MGMNRKLALAIAGIAVLGIGWYLFRPERLIIDRRVEEAPAAASAAVLARGQFRGIAHETRGSATIHETSSGRVLRLTDFETSDGPDVRVYLVAAPDASSDDAVKNAEIVDLGALKGNIGDQNYALPPGIDLAKYRSVTIWCRRFSVNFATAPLTPRT